MSEAEKTNEKSILDLQTEKVNCIFFNKESRSGFIGEASICVEKNKKEHFFEFNISSGGLTIDERKGLYILMSDSLYDYKELAYSFEELALEYFKKEDSELTKCYFFPFDPESEVINKALFETSIKEVKELFKAGAFKRVVGEYSPP